MKILAFIRILIMNKQHSDISEANPYVNVFLFNMEHGEGSKILLKELVLFIFLGLVYLPLHVVT